MKKLIVSLCIVCTKYGPPQDVLKLEEVPTPTPSDSEVLVKVQAASVNYSTMSYVTGKPFVIRPTTGLLKPKYRIPGAEIAMINNVNQKDLYVLKEFIEAGTVKPVIDKRYQFNEVAEALRYYGEGHSRGKVVISVP